MCSQCGYDEPYDEPSNEELGIECFTGWKLITAWAACAGYIAVFYYGVIRFLAPLICKL